MKTQKLSLDFLKSTDYLTREEKKNILAGSGSGSGNVCRIYSNGSWSSCWLTPSEAAAYYNSYSQVTGYCCASCPVMCY